MRIALSAGHTLTGDGTGADGFINESTENRIMFDLVKKWLEKDDHTVFVCNVDKGNNYLSQQVALANKQSVDVAVQIHFNACITTTLAMGTETLYVSTKGKVFADRVNAKLATKFKNRGTKKRTDLYWLNGCVAPTILIEVCFVDSKADVDIYSKNKDAIAKLIAEGIVNKTISGETSSSTNNDNTKPNYSVGTYQKDVKVNTSSSSTLTVRSGRGTEYSKIGSFTNGTIVNVWYIDKAKDGSLWGSCSYNGKTGYIHMGYTLPL